MEHRKFLEELNVRDKAEGNELSLVVSVTFLMGVLLFPSPYKAHAREFRRE